jgi:hypothetical protein
MTRLSLVLVAALAILPGPREARAQSATSALAGANEYVAVILGDTLWPVFSMSASDTAMLHPVGKVAIVKSCGAPRIFLRVFHPVASAVPGSFTARNPANPAATTATIWGPLSSDTVHHQVIDSTATTGPCAPAGAPGACTVDGSLSVDPMSLPAPDCNLSRNRFLATPALDSLIDRFIARTYPAPP